MCSSVNVGNDDNDDDDDDDVDDDDDANDSITLVCSLHTLADSRTNHEVPKIGCDGSVLLGTVFKIPRLIFKRLCFAPQNSIFL